MRIDKLLCDCGIGTRSEVKKFIKQGLVKVNSVVIKDAGFNVSETSDEIMYKNALIHYEKDFYFLFHKPAGCVTANKDNVHKTVFEYFPENIRHKLNAAGRLDVDTEGLLIITSDGSFLHHLISPKHEVPKKYYAILDAPVPDSAVLNFNKGIDIGDETNTLPAELEILEPNEDIKFHALLTIHEGRFHQVKRMFHAVGCEVTYLKRISEGTISLGDLNAGEYRKLTEEEIQSLY